MGKLNAFKVGSALIGLSLALGACGRSQMGQLHQPGDSTANNRLMKLRCASKKKENLEGIEENRTLKMSKESYGLLLITKSSEDGIETQKISYKEAADPNAKDAAGLLKQNQIGAQYDCETLIAQIKMPGQVFEGLIKELSHKKLVLERALENRKVGYTTIHETQKLTVEVEGLDPQAKMDKLHVEDGHNKVIFTIDRQIMEMSNSLGAQPKLKNRRSVIVSETVPALHDAIVHEISEDLLATLIETDAIEKAPEALKTNIRGKLLERAKALKKDPVFNGQVNEDKLELKQMVVPGETVKLNYDLIAQLEEFYGANLEIIKTLSKADPVQKAPEKPKTH